MRDGVVLWHLNLDGVSFGLSFPDTVRAFLQIYDVRIAEREDLKLVQRSTCLIHKCFVN